MSAAARERPRVGLLGIGLAAYWPQFEGLHERLLGYQREVEERSPRSAPTSSRPVSSTRAEGAREAGDLLAAGARRRRHGLRRDLRDLGAGAARGAGREGAGRDPQPAADAQRSTTRR